ncbi:DUF4258 domain-containing protein [Candidatus Thorarchaeota archaeon]|nr:MAG: DUF4258 domain-containing protein [Candidatus Thorarchaeota archaeon]
MRQRSITRDDVVLVLTKSDESLTDRFGHSIAQMESNGEILRVFFTERDDNIIVITVYKTSKEKYRTW